MVVTIPGASVFPALTRADATQTGNATADDLLAFRKIKTTINIAAAIGSVFPDRRILCALPLLHGTNFVVFTSVFFLAVSFPAEEERRNAEILSAEEH